ncbi:hypothetical protein E2562_000960 [Oryza meyeriana var. granulata]|uniref:Single-stranded DNA binding protein Ssb-like OB fold domain-containing protein n=1 Tax=Oryza meyeriana var. granulata TaxID=110450 RepID=A0A6G1CZ37_9ORYZ|nr:hypothetical protein E2562_000960 [Oryza meyeriana var. granulata]
MCGSEIYTRHRLGPPIADPGPVPAPTSIHILNLPTSSLLFEASQGGSDGARHYGQRTSRRHRAEEESVALAPSGGGVNNIRVEEAAARGKGGVRGHRYSSSTNRRTTSSASTLPTCAANPRLPHHRRHASTSSAPAVDGFDEGVARLNSFLRRQRAAVAELGSGGRPSSRSTKIVLSDASKSISSIAVAICYAWMLASKADAQAAVPVVNMRRLGDHQLRQEDSQGPQATGQLRPPDAPLHPVDLVKPGTTVIFRNAKIDMFKLGQLAEFRSYEGEEMESANPFVEQAAQFSIVAAKVTVTDKEGEDALDKLLLQGLHIEARGLPLTPEF